MFNILGKLFGTDKALESVVNGVKNGLDQLVYTDEEKANDAAKDRSEARKMIISWMDTTKGQNLARRLIALAVVFTWLGQYILAEIFNIGAVWVQTTSVQLNLHTSAQIVSQSAETMNSPVMLILGFYFAAPYMGDMVKNFMKKG